MSLLDIRDDPNYVNANEATKRAIFDQYSQDDADYQNANPATRDAIRQEFGLAAVASTTPELLKPEPSVIDKTATALGVPAEVVEPIERYAVQSAVPGLVARPAVPSADLAQMRLNLGETVSPGYKMGPVGKAVEFVGQEAIDAARIAGKMTPSIAGQMLSRPLYYTQEGIKALAQRYGGPVGSEKSLGSVISGAGQALKQPSTYINAAKNIGKGLVAGAVAPENLLTLPYQMAAYEQEKIRQNPNAPQYATTPYAQQYRGEYATQGAAGAANRRNAIANQQYGGLTQEEQDILEQDRIRREIRRKAAEKVLGPVAPRGY